MNPAYQLKGITNLNHYSFSNCAETIAVQFKKELLYIYSKFYMSEYHNVINADYAIFDIPEQSMDKMKFKLASHPRDNNSIGQGRYLCCWWEQIP